MGTGCRWRPSLVTHDPLERVRIYAGEYPTHLLEGCERGLLLFGAAFLGLNDGIHMLDAGLACTVVDIDPVKLTEMWEAYPKECGWTFLHDDAWEYAEKAELAIGAGLLEPFDVVSVDSWTGTMEQRVNDSLPLWCSLAKKFVTVMIGYGASFTAPVGWTFTILPRSPRARWLILERDPAF